MSNHDQLSMFSAISGAGKVLDTTQTDSSAQADAYNFRLLGTRGLGKTWRDRATDNVAAIRLAQRIEREGRGATEAEQRKLIRFIGFGATDLSKLFPRAGETFVKGWEAIGEDLNRAVTDEERSALARATQYAHYTPEFMIRAIWKALKRMGFTGGAVLEPGCGTGLFLALMPEGIASRSSFLGIENCPTTARISRLLYPEADILNTDFTRAQLPPDFDLAIGNPPFSDRKVHTDGRPDLSLHDFFIARSIERLRAGGIAAFVVSRYTMDKGSTDARSYIASMADLLGAIRMPQGSMRADAGTDVVVDLLFFRKREASEAPASDAWVSADYEAVTGDVKGGFISRYFADHPDMALGEHAITSSQFGPIYTLKPGSSPLDIQLAAAIAKLPENIYQPADPKARSAGQQDKPVELPKVRIGTAAEGATIKEGSYFVRNDVLYQIIDGKPNLIQVKEGRGTPGIFGKHARTIRDMVKVRDAVRAVLRAQQNDQPCLIEQARLSAVYDDFVSRHGPINVTTISERIDPRTGETKEYNRYPNIATFRDDPDCWLVASIENYDPATGTATKGPIFTQRVVSPPIQLEIATPSDALAVVLNEFGRVDMPRIASLLNTTEEEAAEALGDTVYLDPVSKLWETDDSYLSGMVRDKLAAARNAAEADPTFKRNVTALESVQPTDLVPSEITARLGAPWIPAADVKLFCKEIMGVETDIFHTAEIAVWSVHEAPFKASAASTTDWGTPRRHAGLLLLDALQSSIPQIWDKIVDPFDGTEKRVLNPEATEAAKEKLASIKRAFEAWVWTDSDRAERLGAAYNQEFNNLVERRFNGDHLVLPGASPVVQLRKHQMRAVWRQIAAGSTYLAHVVGAGKTFALIAGLMEQRRLGLIRKPMIVVPGHTLAQWSKEFLMLYPNAAILVADEDNFAKDKRQRFIARAATGDWDAIIITHSAFKFIPTPAEFEKQMIEAQLVQYESMIDAIDKEDRISRKKIEALKEKMKEKLEDLESRKDDMVHIGEIGVDHIAIDEAQDFRKLTFATNMSGLKGIDPDGSQRAWHLYVATRYIGENHHARRAVSMASGTPITNTMGEMFTLLRFMHEAGLTLHNVQHFDAWAATFGETKTELELLPSGHYKPVTRFAEFVNIPELTKMFLDVADVVMQDDLRQYVKLPTIRGGKRQILTFRGSPAFKAYQKVLGARIEAIKQRSGPPNPGDDIILVVINDGRHVAIDTRLIDPGHDMRIAGVNLTYDDLPALRDAHSNDTENKLNGLVENVYRIWLETKDNLYTDPNTGNPYRLPGAAQMVFSDLGTEAAEEKRGFSAYSWIRRQLIAKGVPAEEIAIMQHYKKSAQKQRLFNDVNSGRKRILVGSSETMGTGVNAQQRLVALHHLDVPWLPSLIGQREGRIERQGNQNDEIQIYAYATLGSMDATMWQTVERKQRFIAAVLKGDSSIRRLEDLEASQADQFAMAKALASGDGRLMRKAGLETEIARLWRQRQAHYDSQANVRRQIRYAKEEIERGTAAITQIEADVAARVLPSPDEFSMVLGDKTITDRKEAQEAIAAALNEANQRFTEGVWTFANYCGFQIEADGNLKRKGNGELFFNTENKKVYSLRLDVRRNNRFTKVYEQDLKSADALLKRIEAVVEGFEDEIAEQRQRVTTNGNTVKDFSLRLGGDFDLQPELDAKEAELRDLNSELEKSGEIANDDDARVAPEMAA